jgi:hypothetical protein
VGDHDGAPRRSEIVEQRQEDPEDESGLFSSSAPMAGYPKLYNIQMDPHEDLQVGALFGWTFGPMFEEVEKYLESVKKYPNPPAPNITSFTSHSRPGG